MSTLTPKLRSAMAIVASLLVVQPPATFAASHREAPITALDQKADITDWFAFVSPEHPDRVIFIMNVDPFLEPSNGPNYFPFDPGILYEMKIDNNHDGVPDITFQFQFQTQITNPGIFTGFVGNLAGIPPITALNGAGAQGLGSSRPTASPWSPAAVVIPISDDQVLYTVPTNVGPRTMPNYASLVQQGIYTLDNGIRVFAGTVADPFFIDLGGVFDSLNLRASVAPVLSAAVDGDDHNNYAPNARVGLQRQLHRAGSSHHHAHQRWPDCTPPATPRPSSEPTPPLPARRSPCSAKRGRGGWAQVQRLGNPLINEAIIGTGAKDRFSMSDPINDDPVRQFPAESAGSADPFNARLARAASAANRPAAAGSVHGAHLPWLHGGTGRSGRRFAPAQHRDSAHQHRLPPSGWDLSPAIRPAFRTDGASRTMCSTSPCARWKASW